MKIMGLSCKFSLKPIHWIKQLKPPIWWSYHGIFFTAMAAMTFRRWLFSDGMGCPFWDDLKPGGLEHDWMIFPYIYNYIYIGDNNPNCYSLHHFPEGQVYQPVSNYGFKLLWILAPTSRQQVDVQWPVGEFYGFLEIQLMGHWVS